MEVQSATATATGSASGASQAKLAENFDTFLTLLTTQLKNQDPLNPMDSTEFTNQLVQFSGVEQAISTNKNLEKLIALNESGNATSLLGYLGKDVELQSDQTMLKSGQAKWQYTIDENATEALLTVTDLNGRIIYTTPAVKTAGQHEFIWDGKDNAGLQVADGAYRLGVSALDITGGKIGTSITTTGRVEGVETADGEDLLTVNGLSVTADKVISVLLPEDPGT